LSKLTKLSNLAKKKTIFDDPAAEIERLTLFLKNDLTNQNKQLDVLAGLVSTENDQTRKNSENIVGLLQKKLAKITSDFREILELRTRTLKDQQKSRMEYTGASSLSEANYPQLEPDRGGEVAISMPDGMMMIQNDTSKNRLESVQRIEGTIVELEGIFQQLRGLVAEQGEMITRIDADIEDTSMNLDKSHSELLKYWGSLTSSRSLTIKIFAVLIAFVVAFVVFFV